VTSLKGRVVIITGAAMGIGRETALTFARAGAAVLAADYDEKHGEETAALVREGGGEAIFVKADVSDPRQVRAMVDRAMSHYGRLDILINNAGVDLPQATSVSATAVEDWDRTLDVNLKGVFLCSKYAIPAMIAGGGGVVINIASIAGLRATPQEAAYVASKGGLLMLTRQMAVDYAADRVRVVAICPGPMEKATRHRLAYLEADESARQRRARLGEHVPLGRLCLPADIAAAALFLASDEASMITGTELVVDGGFTIGWG
jgi:NAD(P)-dependent dehydrogenase (short-subunit alcohol dehydrogenase family)